MLSEDLIPISFSLSILVTAIGPAAEKINDIHHREPLIINRSQINNYLNVKKEAMEILNSIKPPNLKFHVISKDVNNPVNNDPALIKSIN